ncbi:hypothetical protein ACLBWT_18835 [Paenibacillus sp. D51F]
MMKIKLLPAVIAVVAISTVFLTSSISAATKMASKVSIKISNGGSYYGEVKNGLPYGKGSATWPGGKSYAGDWKFGKRSGIGKMISKKNDFTYYTYNGEWMNDQFNGKGSFLSIYTYPTSLDKEGYFYADGEIDNEYQKGIFKNNEFVSGYSGDYFRGRGSDQPINIKYEDSSKKILIKTLTFDNAISEANLYTLITSEKNMNTTSSFWDKTKNYLLHVGYTRLKGSDIETLVLDSTYWDVYFTNGEYEVTQAINGTEITDLGYGPVLQKTVNSEGDDDYDARVDGEKEIKKYQTIFLGKIKNYKNGFEDVIDSIRPSKSQIEETNRTIIDYSI